MAHDLSLTISGFIGGCGTSIIFTAEMAGPNNVEERLITMENA